MKAEISAATKIIADINNNEDTDNISLGPKNAETEHSRSKNVSSQPLSIKSQRKHTADQVTISDNTPPGTTTHIESETTSKSQVVDTGSETIRGYYYDRSVKTKELTTEKTTEKKVTTVTTTPAKETIKPTKERRSVVQKAKPGTFKIKTRYPPVAKSATQAVAITEKSATSDQESSNKPANSSHNPTNTKPTKVPHSQSIVLAPNSSTTTASSVASFAKSSSPVNKTSLSPNKSVQSSASPTKTSVSASIASNSPIKTPATPNKPSYSPHASKLPSSASQPSSPSKPIPTQTQFTAAKEPEAPKKPLASSIAKADAISISSKISVITEESETDVDFYEKLMAKYGIELSDDDDDA